MLLLLALILVGCSGLDTEKLQTDWNSVPTNGEELIVRKREIGEAATEKYYGDATGFYMTYPVFGSKAADDHVKDIVKEISEKFLEESKEYRIVQNVQNELFMDYDVWKEGDYYNVKLEGYTAFSGTNHPSGFVRSFVLDKDLNLVSLQNLNRLNYKDELFKVIKEKSDFLSDKDLEMLPLNYVVTSSGVSFYFDQMKIAAASEGIIRIDVKNKDAKPIDPKVLEHETIEPTQVPKSDQPVDISTIPKGKYVALTFDDGPSKHTEELLDVLKKHQARATFFVLGEQIPRHTKILKRMSDEGHAIGSHGFDHKQMTKLSEHSIKAQIDQVNALCYQATGYRPTLLRPPYGSVNDTVKEVAKASGQSVILWNVDTNDWKFRDDAHVSKWIIDHARNNAIVLCHDLYPTTIKGVDQAIEVLKKEGYVFVTIDELFRLNGLLPEAGRSYTGVKK
ncbi:polysaccharide deacetylase family protein [Guggenheimella bovis]